MRKFFLCVILYECDIRFLRVESQLQPHQQRLEQNTRDRHLCSIMERQTPQREAIRSLFTMQADPLSPQEILDQTSKTVAKISLATVYRTIRSLEERGEIVTVELPGQPPRYELAGKEHHHHFMCEDCGRAFDVDACPGNISRMTPLGFKVLRHEITLYGYCRECQISAS